MYFVDETWSNKYLMSFCDCGNNKFDIIARFQMRFDLKDVTPKIFKFVK